jgi:colanic acid/amylovoran biosynthesis glycosyltransferase
MMDRLQDHKVAGVAEAIEAAGATLRYLPQYPPDLSPMAAALAFFLERCFIFNGCRTQQPTGRRSALVAHVDATLHRQIGGDVGLSRSPFASRDRRTGGEFIQDEKGLREMKVAFATYDVPQDIGGVSTWMQRTLPQLSAAGIEVEVHVMGVRGTNCAFYLERGIPVRFTPWQYHLPHAVRSFLKFLEEGQPDIYVPNCIVPAYFAAGYARRSGIPTVGILHSDDQFYWGVVDEFLKESPEFRLSAIVPVSSFLESEVRSSAAALGVKVKRIAYGVSIPERSAIPPDATFRLIYTGRLEEQQKRVSDVAIALCEAALRIPNLEAWIVGEGRARASVERIIEQNGLGARVQLLGRVNNADIYNVLTQCHGLVLLSDYEGLPVSMLEAMAAGVVPICLDIRSGIREALEHGMNGLIVRDRANDFFDAVKSLQAVPANWQEMSIAARETVRQHYSIETSARQWLDLLQDLNRGRAIRATFKVPRKLQLPLPNPKFGDADMRVPWKRRLQDYTRSMSAIHEAVKVMLQVGSKVKKAINVR